MLLVEVGADVVGDWVDVYFCHALFLHLDVAACGGSSIGHCVGHDEVL